jgi:hypothetical protein
MVSRIRPGRHGAKPSAGRGRIAGRVVFEIGIAIIITGIFSLKIVNYVDPEVLVSSAVSRTIATDTDNAVRAIENIPFLNHCSGGQSIISVSGGYVCAPSGPGNNLYDEIYRSYPLVRRIPTMRRTGGLSFTRYVRVSICCTRIARQARPYTRSSCSGSI